MGFNLWGRFSDIHGSHMISAPSPTQPSKAQPSRLVGRYVMYDEIASGGMASVHFGRMRGAVGFSRTVAIKSLHPHFARDAEFISMFLDEVRLVSRIKHPNVAAPLDVVLIEESAEIFLIMEYIHGETLACLLQGALLAYPCSSIRGCAWSCSFFSPAPFWAFFSASYFNWRTAWARRNSPRRPCPAMGWIAIGRPTRSSPP